MLLDLLLEFASHSCDIHSRGLDITVSKKFRHVKQVTAVVQHQSSECVAESMRRKMHFRYLPHSFNNAFRTTHGERIIPPERSEKVRASALESISVLKISQ